MLQLDNILALQNRAEDFLCIWNDNRDVPVILFGGVMDSSGFCNI